MLTTNLKNEKKNTKKIIFSVLRGGAIELKKLKPFTKSTYQI